MKILLDARMLGHEFGGIGVYSRELFRRLPKIGGAHEWLVMHRPEKKDFIEQILAAGQGNVKLVAADIKHYSWAEQIKLLKILDQLRPDLVHFPNFIRAHALQFDKMIFRAKIKSLLENWHRQFHKSN